MFTLLNRFSKYSVVILGFLTITLSHAQDDRAEDISILDVDGSGEVDALTDGLLILRSMFGLTDDVLITGVVAADASVTDSTAIDSYISSIKGMTYGQLTSGIGPAGPQGEKGDTGATGPQGNQGNQGATGAAGADGSDGAIGPQGATGATGPQGNQGNQGNQGATGAAGADGSDGATGSTGPAGATGAAGADGSDGATGSTGPAGATGAAGAAGATGAQGAIGNPYAGDWSNLTTYEKGKMVFYRREPYWALLTHSGTEPGSESLSCSSWDSSESLNWIGLSGTPSSSCTWTGGTTSNYRGSDATAFTSYGSLNSGADMVTGSDSSLRVTTGQGLKITSLKVVVNVGWDHLNISPVNGWNFKLVVDGAAVSDGTCTLGGVQTRSIGGSGKSLECSTTPNYYINSSSTISIASNWNATRSWRDQVDNESDIDWYVGYSLSDP